MLLWSDWNKHGNYPYPGGRLAQSLSTLARMEAISFLVSTKRKMGENDDWKKLSLEQTVLLKWLYLEDEGWESFAKAHKDNIVELEEN